MSQPAWYPDPSGQPGSFRYWNGQTWSAETTANPSDPPPPSAQWGATQQPGQQPDQTQQLPAQEWGQQWGQQSGQQPGQQWGQAGQQPQQWSPMPDPGDGSGGSGKKGLWVAVVGVVVVLLLVGGGVVAWLTLGDDDDDDKSADEDSSQTTEPTDESTDQATDQPTDQTTESTDGPTEGDPTDGVEPLTDCPAANPATNGPSSASKISSGGISAPVAPGYSAGAQADAYAKAFTWLTGPRGEYRTVEQSEEGAAGWISLFVVGSVERAQGYGTLESAAQSVTNCMAGSENMYRNQSGVTSKGSKEMTVDGHKAWRVDTEIEVDDPEVDAKGDHAIVVAVEVDNSDTYAIFAGVVPIGDQKLLKQLEKVVSGITVD